MSVFPVSSVVIIILISVSVMALVVVVVFSFIVIFVVSSCVAIMTLCGSPILIFFFAMFSIQLVVAFFETMISGVGIALCVVFVVD